MSQILFVCTANKVRSPLAQGLLEQRLEADSMEESWEIASAGTWTMEGRRADRTALKLLAERGIDLSGHRTREVDEEMLAGADLVLAMESGHKEALQVEFPEQAGKVYLLSELEGEVDPVWDPKDLHEEAYRETIEKIDSFLEGAPDSIKALLENG